MDRAVPANRDISVSAVRTAATAAGSSGPARLLAASTLGAPELDLRQISRLLRSRGLTGIEIQPRSLPRDAVPGSARLTAIGRALQRDGFTFVAVSSPLALGSGSDESMLSDLRETVRMASQLSASHVRVFPGGLRGDVPPDSTHEPAVDQPVEDLIVDRLVRASAIAARHGLVLCVETHDSHPSGAAVARMLNRAEREGAAPEALGVVWDALHPWRVGEQPSRTAEILSPWLGAGRGWVQVKDVRDEHDLRPVLLGRGRVPIDKMRGALLAIGYHGVVSLEWERLWFPEISSLGHAIASAQTRLHAWMDAGSTCTAEPQVR